MESDAAKKDPAMSGQLDYARMENDFYPTPVKFVHCLSEHLPLKGTKWWEPAAGEGHIAFEVEWITKSEVVLSDIVRYPKLGNAHMFVSDFLRMEKAPDGVTGIITNPPYLTVNVEDEDWAYLLPLCRRYGLKRLKKVSLAELFLRHAIALMQPVQGKVAMFLRNEFDCGKGRMDLFKHHVAYHAKVVCTERPRWIEGSTGSPRHNYSWFVFDWKNRDEPRVLYSHPDQALPILTIN